MIRGAGENPEERCIRFHRARLSFSPLGSDVAVRLGGEGGREASLWKLNQLYFGTTSRGSMRDITGGTAPRSACATGKVSIIFNLALLGFGSIQMRFPLFVPLTSISGPVQCEKVPSKQQIRGSTDMFTRNVKNSDADA